MDYRALIGFVVGVDSTPFGDVVVFSKGKGRKLEEYFYNGEDSWVYHCQNVQGRGRSPFEAKNNAMLVPEFDDRDLM